MALVPCVALAATPLGFTELLVPEGSGSRLLGAVAMLVASSVVLALGSIESAVAGQAFTERSPAAGWAMLPGALDAAFRFPRACWFLSALPVALSAALRGIRFDVQLAATGLLSSGLVWLHPFEELGPQCMPHHAWMLAFNEVAYRAFIVTPPLLVVVRWGATVLRPERSA